MFSELGQNRKKSKISQKSAEFPIFSQPLWARNIFAPLALRRDSKVPFFIMSLKSTEGANMFLAHSVASKGANYGKNQNRSVSPEGAAMFTCQEKDVCNTM